MALSRSRLALVIATICLAMMVVALGAAAKHSQFESASHSTHYLKQSIKMVSGDHGHASLVLPVASPFPSKMTVGVQVHSVSVRVSVPFSITVPLLI